MVHFAYGRFLVSRNCPPKRRSEKEMGCVVAFCPQQYRSNAMIYYSTPTDYTTLPGAKGGLFPALTKSTTFFVDVSLACSLLSFASSR